MRALAQGLVILGMLATAAVGWAQSAEPLATYVGGAPLLSLQVLLEGGQRVRDQDQFTVEILDQNRAIASATSQGSGAVVLAGALSAVRLVARRTYSVSVRLASGSPSDNLDYSARLQCSNRFGNGTPVDNLLSLQDRFTLQARDRVTCVAYKRPKFSSLRIQTQSHDGVGTFQYESVRNADGLNVLGGYAVTTLQAGLAAQGSRVMVTQSLEQTEIRELEQSDWKLVSAGCVDLNAQREGVANREFGTLEGNTLKIPAVEVLPRAALLCTFVSVFNGWDLTGKVILDTGEGQGSAHDGVQNGGEQGQSSVALQLTDCKGQIHSRALTDNLGRFRLPVVRQVIGQRVCLEDVTPTGHRRVSRHPGSTQGRLEGDSERLAFTWQPGVRYSGVVFGNAPDSTLDGEGLRAVGAAKRARHISRYVAGSRGWVTFSIDVLNPQPTSHWQHAWYLDAHCNAGSMQALPAVPRGPVLMLAGQSLCLVLEVQSPPDGVSGLRHQARITATEVWGVPTLQRPKRLQTLQRINTTLLGSSGLSLYLEHRKLDACPQDAADSLANRQPYGEVATLAPGAALEYRITYFNTSDSPLTGLEIRDHIPRYTSLGRAVCLKTPEQGIQSCAVVDDPGTGAHFGALRWRLMDATGARRGLQPQDSGAVGFCLYVQD